MIMLICGNNNGGNIVLFFKHQIGFDLLSKALSIYLSSDTESINF